MSAKLLLLDIIHILQIQHFSKSKKVFLLDLVMIDNYNTCGFRPCFEKMLSRPWNPFKTAFPIRCAANLSKMLWCKK